MIRKKLWKQLIAAMLAVTMVITSVDLPVSAATAEVTESSVVSAIIAYTYDTGGNILNKKIYAYTTAESLSGLTVQTINYTYDSTWKD